MKRRRRAICSQGPFGVGILRVGVGVRLDLEDETGVGDFLGGGDCFTGFGAGAVSGLAADRSQVNISLLFNRGGTWRPRRVASALICATLLLAGAL